MIIRPATTSDASQIAVIWNKVIAHSLATFTTELKTDVELTRMISAREGAFWVAADEVVRGFATFGPFRSGPGYAATVEHTVILAEGAQRQGLGTSLMGVATEGAAAKGAHIMVAGVSAANPRAIAFHAHLGFKQTAHMPQVGRKAGRWLDLILMQKTIGST